MDAALMDIWEGIFATFEESHGSTEVFGEPLWAERSRTKAEQLIEASRSPGFTPVTNRCHEYCLPVVAALLQAERGHLRVLEYGGSVGLSFHALVDALPEPPRVEVHVVDTESICAAGREAFVGESRIAFHTTCPSDVVFDLVHLGSAIQYAPDWTGLLCSLVSTRPKYLVLDDVPAGDIPTFASLQNYYGRKIPHWFFNIREFVDGVTRATGYRLAYKTRYVGTFLGRTGPFPMDNFPEDHRIDNAYNLAFVAP